MSENITLLELNVQPLLSVVANVWRRRNRSKD